MFRLFERGFRLARPADGASCIRARTGASFVPRVEALEGRLALSQLLGLAVNSTLLEFDSLKPSVITRTLKISGLQGTGDEVVMAIDVRPRTGQLYALGVQNAGATDILRLYIVSESTGAATEVGGPINNVPASANYGMGFNPGTDVLRVTNSSNSNLRIDPVTGLVSAVDTPLSPTTTEVSGIGFDRNYDSLLGATGTTLYAIESKTDELVTIGGANASPSPNTGTLVNVGGLGVPINPNDGVGFNIPATAPVGGDGYAVFTDLVSHLTGLYSIDLSTGAATKIGNVGGGDAPLMGLAVLPESLIAVGSDPGTQADVRVFDAATQEQVLSLTPFPGFKGGVSVALGDINDDGAQDVIVGAGAGPAGGHIEVFDGRTGALIRSFLAFPNWTGGVSVAAGDVNGDGYSDIVAIANGSVGGHIEVFSGLDNSVIGNFLAFGQYPGPISIATADFNNSGTDDIVIGVAQNGQIKIYTGNGGTPTGLGIPTYFIENKGVTRTISVAAGDVTGDGVPDIIVSELYGNGIVKVFSGTNGSQVLKFDAVSGASANGASVAVADVTGDGKLDIVTASGPGFPTEIQTFDGTNGTLASSFIPYQNYSGGASVAGS